jgi:hypothetical protein
MQNTACSLPFFVRESCNPVWKDDDMSTAPPEWTPDGGYPPKKPGMSTAAKILIALAVLMGLCVLLCCGGVMGLGFFAQRFAQQAISQDPGVIAAKTGEITQIEIPDGLQPAGSFDMNVPFVGRMMLWTIYEDKQSNSSLVMFTVGERFASQTQDGMRQTMDQSLRQQGQAGQEQIQDGESSTKQIEIRGQQATFTVIKGKGQDSGAPRIQVVGFFQGETGPAMLMFDGDAEKYSEEQLIEMLESIE